MVDGVLENTAEQYQKFSEVRDRPHILVMTLSTALSGSTKRRSTTYGFMNSNSPGGRVNL
jgi:hypothetical protein